MHKFGSQKKQKFDDITKYSLVFAKQSEGKNASHCFAVIPIQIY